MVLCLYSLFWTVSELQLQYNKQGAKVQKAHHSYGAFGPCLLQPCCCRFLRALPPQTNLPSSQPALLPAVRYLLTSSLPSPCPSSCCSWPALLLPCLLFLLVCFDLLLLPCKPLWPVSLPTDLFP